MRSLWYTLRDSKFNQTWRGQRRPDSELHQLTFPIRGRCFDSVPHDGDGQQPRSWFRGACEPAASSEQ